MSGALDGTPTRRPAARFRTFAWVAAIAIGSGFATYLVLPDGWAASNVRRSFFRTTPDGVAGLARAIARFDRPAAPRITPLADAGPVPGALLLLSPVVTPSPAEVHALLERVRGGGTLVYAPPLAQTAYARLAVTPFMDSLGIAFRQPGSGDLLSPRWVPDPLTEGLAAPRAPRRVLQWTGRPDSVPGRRTVRRLEELLATGQTDARRTGAAARILLGEGRILVLSDAEPLSNAHAADDPLAPLAIRLLLTHTAPGDTIFFDEFHQGIRSYDSTAERWTGFFLGSAGGRTLLHVLLVTFLALACAGLRFGAPMTPVAPPDRERRSPLEHVAALGDLYEKAGAARTAALILLARLARIARRPPPRDLPEAEALIGELEARRGAHPALDRIRRGLREQPVDLTMIAAGIDDHLKTKI